MVIQMYKKVLIPLISLLLIFSLIACFGNNKNEGNNNQNINLNQNELNNKNENDLTNNKNDEIKNDSTVNDKNNSNNSSNNQDKNPTLENDNETIDTPNLDVVEKKESYYEEWLAAAMCMSLTFYEDEFEILNIYYKSKTKLEDKMDSEGVYLIYKNSEGTICLHSSPLEKECTDEGVTNLYSQDVGFNTYEKLSVKKINFANYEEFEIDSLSKIISQSVLVSLYEN